MDTRNVRLLKAYPGGCEDGTIYVDENARAALSTQWGDEVRAIGSRPVLLKLAPLQEEDTDAYVARVTRKTIEELECVYGDEVLLYNKND